MQPSSSSVPKIGPAQMSKFGFGLGVVMIAIGLIWVAVLRGQDAIRVWFGGDAQSAVLDVALGFSIGTLVAVLVATLGHHIEGFQRIKGLLAMRIELATFSRWDCVWLALLAAIPEEILFRGAMQPSLGLVLTAIIFGVLHGITRLYLIYATVAGLLLGGLYEFNQTLWMPIAAHFAVDYFSLLWMSAWARRNVLPPDPLHEWLAFGIADRGDTLESPQ